MTEKPRNPETPQEQQYRVSAHRENPLDTQSIKEAINTVHKERDVETLYNTIYRTETQPTTGQLEIMRRIIYPENNADRNLMINCYTRYGKSWTVVRSIGILLALNDHYTAAFIAKKRHLLDGMRKYMGEAVIESPTLQSLVQLQTKDTERLRSESTKTAQTLSNGSAYYFLSAYNASDLQGKGADIVILEEDTQIGREEHNYITRMLGDAKTQPQEIRLFNPVSANTDTYDKWRHDDTRGKIHIDIDQGIREGRPHKEHKRRSKQDMTETHYQIFMESKFPDKTDEGLLGADDIHDIPSQAREKQGDLYVGVDVASQGSDRSVITMREKRVEGSTVFLTYSESKTDTHDLSRRVVRLVEEYHADYDEVTVNIDGTGVGDGVYSHVNNALRGDENPRILVQRVMFGSNPASRNKKTHRNHKAELFWSLKRAIENKELSITSSERTMYLRELRKQEYELDTRGRIRIRKSSDSPDYVDSLALTYAEPNTVRLGYA